MNETKDGWYSATVGEPPIERVIVWVEVSVENGSIVKLGFWYNGDWWNATVTAGDRTRLEVASWRPLETPAPPGAETIDPFNPPSGGSAVTSPIDPTVLALQRTTAAIIRFGELWQEEAERFLKDIKEAFHA